MYNLYIHIKNIEKVKRLIPNWEKKLQGQCEIQLISLTYKELL